jgi:poly-gamma-glutamate system protein
MRAPLLPTYAGGTPVPISRLIWVSLASLLLLFLVERSLARMTSPYLTEMLRAARAMQTASQAIHDEKARRGLLQPASVDVNLTGFIGPEWSETTTTLGTLSAKRTASNPDVAALLVRLITRHRAATGNAALIIVSGSFVGGNIAAIAAAEALGLNPIVVSSLGASMFGATDPGFTWLDIEAVLRREGVITSSSLFAVLGGVDGIAKDLGEEGRMALLDAAARNGVPLIEGPSLDVLLDRAEANAVAAVGSPGEVAIVINVGGSELAIGDCAEGDRIAAGLESDMGRCEGVPGLMQRLARAGRPVISLLNLRRLALDTGLPYDPVPLPVIGNNTKIYSGRGR